MTALGVRDDKLAACAFKVKIYLFDSRIINVRKIYENKSADRRYQLIHQTAVLAEVNVFGKLTYLGDLHRSRTVFIVIAVYGG